MQAEPSLIIRYATYLGFFLGIGLFSGSIVHMPLQPTRYLPIMVIGVLLFLAASLVTELYLEKKAMPPLQIVRSLFFALCLSVGIGMMSGGIQHFSDDVTYASYLIPIGFGISLFSYVFKNEVQIDRRKLTAVLGLFLAVGIPLRLSLAYVAAQAPTVVVGDGHSDHSH